MSDQVALLIDRPGGVVVVNGVVVTGLDLDGLPDGMTRAHWSGRQGAAEVHGQTVLLPDLDGLQWVLAAHAARVEDVAAATPGPDPSLAVQRKLADIVRHVRTLQHEHLVHDGHLYYADEDSLATITTTLAMVQMLGDTDPVPTPPPVTGCWLTADVDAQTGQREVVAMTCGGFKRLARALYDRNAALWGAKQVHYATVEAMAAGGATAEQILQYDHTAGWPTT